jgi:hypothetical protein
MLERSKSFDDTQFSSISKDILDTKKLRNEVVVEGWLKKIRSLFKINTRAYFKVIGTQMFKESKFKYDLTLYVVGLSDKDKRELFF